ncbi:protein DETOXIFICATION 8-like [Carica papaya]|uniref:protein DETOXIFICATION 8-like n=1 Tax=Carica papaya TaxID=3649 RepID=UPI000B8D0BD1|nr:protein DETOXIFICATION 8-like [Carica papaya]
MTGALESLCGQAYGAGEYKKLGSYTYTASLCLIIACIPICILWIFTDKLLILNGQDPSVSTVARSFSIYLIPRLFAYAVLQPLIRFLQTQSLIYRLEWWSSEVLILLSGILPNPKLETSVITTCFTIVYMHSFATYGFGGSVSTLVSNELGAGNAKVIKRVIATTLIVGTAEVVVGANINLGAFYLVGIPVGAALTFGLHLKSKGLLMGFATGALVQAVLFTAFTNWEKTGRK